MKLEKTKLITCILPKGHAKELIELLKKEKKVITANMNTARGAGVGTTRGTIVTQVEKDILTVLVEESQSDDLFEYIYEKANVDHPHGGFVYMGKAITSVPYILPDVPDEA